MPISQDELDMLSTLASAPQGQSAQQPQGMIQTDPGSMDAFLRNQQIMQQLGAVSADPEKRAALDKQMQLAKYLGVGPNMPHGEHIPGFMGGVYVAPNALQNLAAVGGHITGGLLGQKVAGEESDMASREARARTAIMQMYNDQFNRAPLMGPDYSQLQNPLENYNFGPEGAPPRNTNLVPRQQPPRQMTPDEFGQLAVPGM